MAEAVYDMLKPGGALVLVKHEPAEPPAVGPGPPPIPHAEIETLVEKYLGSTRRAGQGAAPAVRIDSAEEDAIAQTRFGVPGVIFVPGIPDVVRDTESVLSGYFSFSFSAPHLFGDRVEAFATEVRELLRARSPEGVFWDWPGNAKVVIATASSLPLRVGCAGIG